MYFPTLMFCPPCEVWGSHDACWVCGGPMVADHRLRPKWVNTHTYSPDRAHTLWRTGVTVACGPLIDDLV